MRERVVSRSDDFAARCWGCAPSERAAEQMNQRMAEHAEAFGMQHAAPPPDEEAEILVATADGKGVPMRRPLEERVRRGPRRGKGEKANKKQMAYVGAVYTIDRFRRTADEVVDELARKERAADRPAPQHKQVWAEMTRVAEGEACTGRERLFVEMAIACHERDPTRQKTLVCLMDGEAALWNVQREWLAGPWASWICFTCWNGCGRRPTSFTAKGAARPNSLSRTTCGCCCRERWAK